MIFALHSVFFDITGRACRRPDNIIDMPKNERQDARQVGDISVVNAKIQI